MIKLSSKLLIATHVVVASFLVGALVPSIAQEKSVSVNGVTLQYIEKGEGEPVILVHGAISDLRSWSAQVPDLAKDFRVISYTQRYYGTAPWPDKGENFSRETMAKDLIALIKALDLGPVHMVTWSNGGSVGTIAEVNAPELFRSVVHYEPVWDQQLETTDEGNASFEQIGAALAPAREAIGAGDLDHGIALFLDAVWEQPGAFSRVGPLWHTVLMDQKRTLTLEAGPLPPVSCEMLGDLKIPTLVVLGENTRLDYFRLGAKEMSRCLADAELAMLPGATHGGPFQNPKAFNAQIIDFLKAH